MISNNASYNNVAGINVLMMSSDNLVKGNIARNNSETGISLFYAGENNTIIGNDLYGNGYEGIWLKDSSKNGIFDNIMSNNRDGIVLKNSSDNNKLMNNTVNANKENGILLDSSSNNSFYNNIFNNTNNSKLKNNSVNKWNITKTPGTNIVGGPYLGGNFWAHPNGTGFSQTCADGNSDGICDSPYALKCNNTDYLPLAYKLTPAVPGDANGDGTVDYKDLAILGASYGKSRGQSGYDARADFNGDGTVDYKDLAILGAKYGTSA